MAKRNGVPLDIIWMHVTTGDPQYPGLLATSEAKHRTVGNHLELSVNAKADGTEALIKVGSALPAWITGKPWVSLVIRTFTEADHVDALTLVRDPTWSTPPP